MSRTEQQLEKERPAKRKRTRKPKGKKNVWLEATVVAAIIGGISMVAVALIQDSPHPSTPSVNASANSAVAIGGNAVAISGNGNNSPIAVNGNPERTSREDKFLEILKVTGKIIDSVQREQTNNIRKSPSTSADGNGNL